MTNELRQLHRRIEQDLRQQMAEDLELIQGIRTKFKAVSSITETADKIIFELVRRLTGG